MPDALALRRQVLNLSSYEEFFFLVDGYKDDMKVYAFCFYTFMEKLCIHKNAFDSGENFVKICKERNIPEGIIELLTRMVENMK